MDSSVISSFDPPKTSYASLEKEDKKWLKMLLTENMVRVFKEIYVKRGIQRLLESIKLTYGLKKSDSRYYYLVHRVLKMIPQQEFPKNPSSCKPQKHSAGAAESLLKQYENLIEEFISAIKKNMEDRISDFNKKNGSSTPLKITVKKEEISDSYQTLLSIIVKGMNFQQLGREEEEITLFIFETNKDKFDKFWENFFIPTPELVPKRPKKPGDRYVSGLASLKIPKSYTNLSSKQELRSLAGSLAVSVGGKINNPPDTVYLRRKVKYDKRVDLISGYPEREFLIRQITALLSKEFPEKRNRDLQRYAILFGTSDIVERTPKAAKKA